MGKQVAQGTRHESAIRKRARQHGRTARRTAKTATKHEPDVVVDGVDTLPALFWKNYYGNGKRRKSLNMVVLTEPDFWKLYDLDTQERYGLNIQAKATQRLSVRATLQGLIDWMRDALDKH